MSIKLIGKISITPETVVPGQSVLVAVHSLDGPAFTVEDDIIVRINGLIGPAQYLQFDKPGKKNLLVSAAKEGEVETQNFQIEVADIFSSNVLANTINPRFVALSFNSKIRSLPILNLTRSKSQPFKAAISLGNKYLGNTFFSESPLINYNETKSGKQKTFVSIINKKVGIVPESSSRFSGVALTPSQVIPKSAMADMGLVQEALKGSEFLHSLFKDAKPRDLPHIEEKLSMKDAIKPRFVATPVPGGITIEPFGNTNGLTFHWDFGNGASLITQELSVEHDYESSLDPEKEHQVFHVKCTIKEPGQPDIQVARTLYIHNAYALCKRMGSIVPKTTSSVFATKVLDGWEGTITINNVEPFPITFDTKMIYPLMQDGNHLTIPFRESLENQISLIVPAKGSVVIPVTLPHSLLTDDSIGFAVIYTGTTESGHRIISEAFFDLPANERSKNLPKIGNFALKQILKQRKGIVSPNLTQPNNPIGTHANRFSNAKVQFSTKAKLFDLTFGKSFLNPTTFSVDKLPNAERSILLDTKVQPSLVKIPSNIGLLHDLVADKNSQISKPKDASVEAAVSHLRQIGLLSRGLQAMDYKFAAPPVEGAECDPDNTPDEVADNPDSNFACQATEETRQIRTPGRFLNARKGDIVLSPGGPGLIGQLLRQVNPPQRYAHSGMMTRNYDQITHSTASEDRMMDYPVGSVPDPTPLDPFRTAPAPTEGHRPDVVRYGWPGVITQSVEAAINGEMLIDPESQKSYNISAFSREDVGASIGGIWEIIHPIVIRPDYILESRNNQIRTDLHKVANDALSLTGKSHYRFYCYTDPTIIDDPSKKGQADAGWAAGTVPTVCSSFIWHVLKKNNVHLESDNEFVSDTDLEPSDKVIGTLTGGGEVRNDTKDGLYLYTADERKAGAEYLYNSLRDKVEAKLDEKGILGSVVGFTSDIKDDVANQVVNAFASDWCETEAKDSEKWKDLSAANAVSPDNIFLWDSPLQKGLYGSFAPLVYREPRLETVTVHKWKKILVKGSLSGTVYYNGGIQGDVLIQLYDGMTTASDGSGNYRLDHVPVGEYHIKASFTDPSGIYLSADVPVTINASQTIVDIELKGPSDLYRKLSIDATINVFDYKEVGHNQSNTERLYREIYLGPFGTHGETSMSISADDGDNVATLRVVADWNLDKSITIQFFHTMTEGGDNEGSTNRSFVLQPDYWQSWRSRIEDSQVGGSDSSQIDVTFTNNINPH